MYRAGLCFSVFSVNIIFITKVPLPNQDKDIFILWFRPVVALTWKPTVDLCKYRNVSLLPLSFSGVFYLQLPSACK